MKTRIFVLGLTLVTALLQFSIATAQELPIEWLLPSFESLLSQKEQLNLSEAQIEAIREAEESATAKFNVIREEVEKEESNLRSVLMAPDLNEESIVSQLERLTNAEEQLKRFRVRTLIRINKVLTTEQREKLLAKLRKEAITRREKLETAILEIRSLAERYRQSGQSVGPIEQRVRGAERLYKSGEFAEAESVLKQTIEELRRATGGNANAATNLQSGPAGVGALSDALRQRIANVREAALEKKDIKAVQALCRIAEIVRDESHSVNQTQLERELVKIEERLGITESNTATEHLDSCALVPQRLYADINYASDNAAVDPHRTLDIYSPSGAVNAPVLVFIHGGGLTGGDKAHPGITLIKPDFFLAQGFVFISVNYRLMPEHVYPTFMNDAAQAIAWIHNNVTKYGGDPAKLNLMGHSAGAHIASLMATNQSFLERQGKTRDIIKSVVSLDIASYDLARRLKEMGPERKSTLYIQAYGEDENTWIEGSPARQIEADEEIPPFLLVYAADHQEGAVMRSENESFFKKLNEHGVAVKLHAAADRTHESVNLKIGFRGDPASKEIMSFLSK